MFPPARLTTSQTQVCWTSTVCSRNWMFPRQCFPPEPVQKHPKPVRGKIKQRWQVTLCVCVCLNPRRCRVSGTALPLMQILARNSQNALRAQVELRAEWRQTCQNSSRPLLHVKSCKVSLISTLKCVIKRSSQKLHSNLLLKLFVQTEAETVPFLPLQ